MSDNPYRIEGPALISFSGGRTSAYMLHEIVRAYDGRLPPDVFVAFANTGKEREETLRFVHECGSRWGVRVRWVEWRPTVKQAKRAKLHAPPYLHDWIDEHATSWGFEEVGINSASRNGEPFDAAIALKGSRLPNGQERWCTELLKVKAMHAFMRNHEMGEPGDYLEPIGLRHDEGHRILSGLARAESDGRRVVYPLGNAKVTKRDVRAFWYGPDRRYETSIQPQGFDLELSELWGNCTLCFAMGVEVREERIRQRPEVADWWMSGERRTGGTFSKRESVRTLILRAEAHKETADLFGDALDDSECGTWCPGEAA